MEVADGSLDAGSELLPFPTAGIDGWIAKLDVSDGGGLQLDPEFLTVDFDGRLPHQIRLEGGDASSDSYCFP